MIFVEDGYFYAPRNAPYWKLLKDANWSEYGDWYRTDDPARVLPVVDYLDPSLTQAVETTADDFLESCADAPTEGFTVPLPGNLPSHINPIPYQLAAVEYCIKRRNTLLAEDAGMGKSMIMTLVGNKMNVDSVLIICPSVAKYNWSENEWPLWTTRKHLSVGVVEKDDWTDTDVVVINYDILHRHKRNLQSRVWDLMLVDESHRAKNEAARRSIMILGGILKMSKEDAEKHDLELVKHPNKYSVPRIEAQKTIFATATPMNRPKDLWTMARRCDPDGLGKDWDYFHKRYCGAYHGERGLDINGATNLEELGALMRARFMVRHDPDKVLDLPPLREDIFLLPPVKIVLDEEQEFVHANIDALLNLSVAMGQPLGKEDSPDKFLRLIGSAILENVSLIGHPDFQPLFSKFAEIRKKTGLAKLPYVIDLINEKTDDCIIPVVAFGYHREFMEGLRKAFPDFSYVVGGMSAKKRKDEVTRFQAGETSGFLGNIDAAGEAITLTRASLAIFGEMDWRGTQMVQARKRIHRISQTQACQVLYACAARSFDAYVAEQAFEKMRNMKETLDLGFN